MEEVKTIAIMTSGGDSPGMNAAIRAVTKAGIYKGFRVIDIDENDTSTYETYLVQWKDYFGSSKMAMNHYNMYAQENSGWVKFTSALKYIPFALLKVLFGYIF